MLLSVVTSNKPTDAFSASQTEVINVNLDLSRVTLELVPSHYSSAGRDGPGTLGLLSRCQFEASNVNPGIVVQTRYSIPILKSLLDG